MDSGAGRMYFIHALTPLHVGTGRGVGFIDLPIMREKITGWPIVPGSTVKGVWRDYASSENVAGDLVATAFGKAEDNIESDHAGSLAITDARMVCLPVRSLYGTFAYVVSPLALKRLCRDMETVGIAPLPMIPDALVDRDILLTSDSVLQYEQKVFFEDLDFAALPHDDAIDKWAELLGKFLFGSNEKYRHVLQQRLALVADGVFDFLCQQGTEVNARIRIDDDKKTVAEHALWYEECLPAESVLAGIVWCDRAIASEFSPQKLLDEFCTPRLCHMGGKTTVGKGFVRCLFAGREG